MKKNNLSKQELIKKITESEKLKIGLKDLIINKNFIKNVPENLQKYDAKKLKKVLNFIEEHKAKK